MTSIQPINQTADLWPFEFVHLISGKGLISQLQLDAQYGTQNS